jgi:two-component system CheB/CheR fusion protein
MIFRIPADPWIVAILRRLTGVPMKKRAKKDVPPAPIPFPSSDAPAAVVGIGASAGGLEAIEAFFKTMPVDSGMAFVVIQHLSPDYKSLMVELLSRKTDIPVHRAEDGMVVQPNHIYLIPPKKNLTIFHGKLLLADQLPRDGINLPVDIFLRSLAEDQGERAVGVVLSGTGSDGTRGVRAIKEWGGLVMVQDEATARFDGMPRAAASTGVADFVLPPGEMAPQLIAWLRHPYSTRQDRQPPELTDETGLTRLFSLLRARTRVDFTHYKPSTITRRIERRIAVTQVADLDAYVRYAEQTPAEVSALYRELLIGVTSFFRDPPVMAVLQDKVLPELFERWGDRELRFWVAGCSTGEEAYTLAILAREVMERLGIARDLKIFATDIDRDAVARAGTGVYPESIAADLTPALLAKYFYCHGDTYRVARTLREMVVFAQHNLVKDPPFTRIDLVSCRNLLIYLQANLQQRALEMFSFSLRPGGILLLGTSETVGEMEGHFEAVDRKARIYRSLGKARGRDLRAEDGAVPRDEPRLPLAADASVLVLHVLPGGIGPALVPDTSAEADAQRALAAAAAQGDG